MKERIELVRACDAIIDTYYGGVSEVEKLMQLRRDLAVNYYYLTDHAKDIHGKAGLSYIGRKYAIAKEVVAAREVDKRAAMDLCEARAETLNHSQEKRKEEVWAEASREAFKIKVDSIKQVLQSMQQEISHLSFEHRTTHYHTETGA